MAGLLSFLAEIAPGDAKRSYTEYRITITRVDSVPGEGETKDDGDEEAEPKVTSWYVDRRFSDFVSLRNALGKLVADVYSVDFPQKVMWGGRNPEVVRVRRFLLPAWLQAISKVPGVAAHPQFQTFVNLPPPVPIM